MAVQIQEVENKNRRLNDIIYNKAAQYKEKILDVLGKNPEQGSPRGRRER
jgi:predicted fused transcriptional regulator/phosphomethylpyrimidine kinase